MRIRQKIFQSASFVAHWFRAVNEHALHPPFIYELFTKAIKARHEQEQFIEIEASRQALLQNHSFLEITELGAGSSLTKNQRRKVCQIARHSLTTTSFSQLLFRLVKFMEARTVLELGTSLGVNSLYLSAAVPEGDVYTLEGCPQTARMAQQLFTRWPTPNIHLKEGAIDIKLPDLLKQIAKPDAVYLDANHTYEATLRYFKLLLPYLHENSFVVIDDIYWSPGMKKAWMEIQQFEEVRMSIDLYDAGILFFRPGLQKEHYILDF